jgi:hypothetical protein
VVVDAAGSGERAAEIGGYHGHSQKPYPRKGLQGGAPEGAAQKSALNFLMERHSSVDIVRASQYTRASWARRPERSHRCQIRVPAP